MRRFSSEGSLLELDFLPWKKGPPRNPDHQDSKESGACTAHNEVDVPDMASARLAILEPRGSPDEAEKRELSRERSISVENLGLQGKRDKNLRSASVLSEGCRAYSDGQLAATAQGATDSEERDELPPPSPSSTSNSFLFKNKLQHKPKLHLRSLFGQSPHSSNSDLVIPEQKDSATERRSRLQFMRQWSQVGQSRKRTIGQEELEEWAQSLNALLASQSGVSVFGAFLRSEFSEENLQFFVACERYRQSSNKFTLHRRAKDICSTYIQPGAPREVNLDGRTRDLTVQLLRAPSHSSLSLAQKRIYSLLDTDCYPRFLHSDLYATLSREAEEKSPARTREQQH
ncbi:regulator of G-protein signaling 8 [Brachionichthys hirsutus]|uniref:regulator of G-protein signaling 8 n=1 Tax=Brachionichthys hirsutus TaxID=412623 RepID=UPI0036043D06